jgi:hypothetical protein
LLDTGLDLGADVYVFGAALGGESHVDGYILLTFWQVIEANVVDQAEVNDVDGNLGIVALLERV